MSVEMMENENVIEDSTEHELHSHESLKMKSHEVDNKHSYFLRAKTPRFLVGDGDGDRDKLKRTSSINRVGVEKDRVSCFHPSSSSSRLSEEEDLANCLVMLSNKPHPVCPNENYKVREVGEKGMFQCKACKKVFNSHQALGGHRASHKKVKGCFASKMEGLNDEENIEEESIQEDHQEQQQPPPPPTSSRKRTKMHECSVCRRIFSSGQALGGHKRCHWLTTSSDNAFIQNFHDFQYDHQTQQLCKKPIFTKAHQYDLDLNLSLPPVPQHHHDDKNKYEGSTTLCLQTHHNRKKTGSDEGCGMKLRKLSDLRDVNLDGGWLQMGIHSTIDIMR